MLRIARDGDDFSRGGRPVSNFLLACNSMTVEYDNGVRGGQGESSGRASESSGGGKADALD